MPGEGGGPITLPGGRAAFLLHTRSSLCDRSIYRYIRIFRADVAARLNGCIRERLIHRVEFSEIKQATHTSLHACMYPLG